MTPFQKAMLFAGQNGMCAICRKEDEKLVIDHDHATGRIRGMLCFHCNIMLGMAKDSQDTLRAAIDYLNG